MKSLLFSCRFAITVSKVFISCLQRLLWQVQALSSLSQHHHGAYASFWCVNTSDVELFIGLDHCAKFGKETMDLMCIVTISVLWNEKWFKSRTGFSSKKTVHNLLCKQINKDYLKWDSADLVSDDWVVKVINVRSISFCWFVFDNDLETCRTLVVWLWSMIMLSFSVSIERVAFLEHQSFLASMMGMFDQ